MVIYEKKIVFALLICSVLATVSLSVSADRAVSDYVEIEANHQKSLENKSTSNLKGSELQRGSRQAEEDDDDSVFERITKGFNRVISSAFKGTVSVVFGTENEEGEREDGIIGNLVKSPLVKPLNALIQSGLTGGQGGKPGKPTKTNVTKKATVVATTTKKSSEDVENEEDDNDDEDSPQSELDDKK